jgi:Cu(I)/Ag(I) efflux system membrane fusion protein
MNRTNTSLLVGLIALAVGGGAGYWFAGQREMDVPMDMPMSMPMDESPAAAEREVLFYRNPMNPAITSPVPAQDNMGMDYIPVYADEAAGAGPAGTVSIDAVTVQNMGVRTATAERRTLAHPIHALGRIEYDEQRITRLHPRTQGWIEDVYVESTGEQITADHILLSIYAPQLVTTQQEYLLALRNLEALETSPFPDVREGARELVDSALDRLRLLGVPEHQVEELMATREASELLHIHSPGGGIATNVGVREGQYVTPQTELYTIADLSRVWALVDIFENELPWVRVGDQASMTIAGAPGTVFEGRLTFIYPYAERQTRTIKGRLEFDNADLVLKPDMIANVTIQASPRENVVAIPSEAIVRSGLREQVFIVREPGRFEPREVELGLSSDGWTEIRSGLAEGEQIVASAQFLIDSESSLREAAAKMREQSGD